ncbi:MULTISPECIES: hypothetical protein [Bacillaceae]|nr:MULTISPECIES: hypothetical protein [Bacillaceae]
MGQFKYEEIGTLNAKLAAEALLKLTLKIKNEDIKIKTPNKPLT